MTFKHLPHPFHWRSIRNISTEEIPNLMNYLGIKIDKDFYLKSNWNYFKQYDVFDIDGHPLFHIKKSMAINVFFEAISLHIARIIDIDLCPNNYIVGNYDVGFWRWKSPIPFVLTTYCEGKTLKKGEILYHLYNIGRHFIFHKFLNLYDVHERHFIFNNNILKRIDYDLSFRELEGKYYGFDRWIKKYDLFNRSEFLQGASFEVKRIKNNLIKNKKDFLEFISALKFICMEKSDDKMYNLFYDKLLKYWENNCSDIFQGLNIKLEEPIYTEK
ncbi:MAG: hypothetical protein ACTSWR_09380 [Candidatus Helarchaeota archaeon]